MLKERYTDRCVPETGEIPIDPNEKHDPSDALTKEDAFGFEW